MNDISNPYQPPSAELPRDDLTGHSGISAARRVKALRGARWIANGLDIVVHGVPGFLLVFLLAFLVMLLPYAAIVMFAVKLVQINPLLMYLPSLIVTPIVTVFWGGMMAGCDQTPFKGGRAIRAMAAHFVPLFILGLWSTLLLVIVMALGGAFAAVGVEAAFELSGVTAFAFGVMSIALTGCYMAALWFSPALVVIGKLRPHIAIARSFTACFKNFFAFVVLVIMVIVLFFATALLLILISAIVMGIVQVAGNVEPTGYAIVAISGIGVILYLLLTGAMLASAISIQYSSFKDVFIRRTNA